MAVASLVLGIVSVVFAVIPGLPDWLAAILGIVGIILGALGKKKGQKNATAGLVLSIIGTVLGLIFYIACAACVASIF